MIAYLFKLFFKIIFFIIKIIFFIIISILKILWFIIKTPFLIIYYIIIFKIFIIRSYNRICKNFFSYPKRLTDSIRNLFNDLFKLKKMKKIDELYNVTSKPVKIPSINFYPPEPEIPILIETIFYLANLVLFIYFFMLIRFMMVRTKEIVSDVDWY